jgi:transposase
VAADASGGRTTTGNVWVWLRAVLGEVAWSITRTSGNYLVALSYRLVRRRGKQKAIIALAHSLLVSSSYMLRDHQPYRDLGPDHFERLESARVQYHYVHRLEQLGYAVTLTPAATS